MASCSSTWRRSSETQLLGPTIAGALGISESGEPVDEALAAHLERRRMLLVLDNLEQLLPAAPQVGTLLSRAPGSAILATSRAPLRLTAEQEYLVPPLSVPAPNAPFEQLSSSDAVRLFAQRARAVDASFQITDANAPSIAAVCARLDGLPLAIELAAARTKLLPPEALAARLGSALDLAAVAPDRPARQQTLRATLDWSCRALAEEERAALAQLSVFAGGFGLDGAEAVCGPGALEPLTTLVEVNLVRRAEAGADPRFAMLETIREYAGELLAASGDEAAARSSQAAYVLAVAEAAAADLAAGEGEPFDRFARDHENVREALAWTASTGDATTEVRLAVAMSWYWAVRGHLAEGRHALEHAIEAARGDTRLSADALVRAGLFPYRQGDLDAARALWEEALRLYRELGNAEGITQCVAELGGVAVAEGDLAGARAAYEEAARGFEQAGNLVRLGIANGNLAAIANMQGDYEAATRFGFDAVALQEKNGDEDGLAVTLQNLSRTILRLGDSARARDARTQPDDRLLARLPGGDRILPRGRCRVRRSGRGRRRVSQAARGIGGGFRAAWCAHGRRGGGERRGGSGRPRGRCRRRSAGRREARRPGACGRRGPRRARRSARPRARRGLGSMPWRSPAAVSAVRCGSS